MGSHTGKAINITLSTYPKHRQNKVEARLKSW